MNVQRRTSTSPFSLHGKFVAGDYSIGMEEAGAPYKYRLRTLEWPCHCRAASSLCLFVAESFEWEILYLPAALDARTIRTGRLIEKLTRVSLFFRGSSPAHNRPARTIVEIFFSLRGRVVIGSRTWLNCRPWQFVESGRRGAPSRANSPRALRPRESLAENHARRTTRGPFITESLISVTEAAPLSHIHALFRTARATAAPNCARLRSAELSSSLVIFKRF